MAKKIERRGVMALIGFGLPLLNTVIALEINSDLFEVESPFICQTIAALTVGGEYL